MLNSSARRHRQCGITLIESLMTLVIISIALLGVASLQLLTLQDMRDASWRASAVNLAGGMLEQLRADRVNADDYAITDNKLQGCGTGTSIACQEMARWLQDVSASLPSSLVNLSVTESASETRAQLAIRWRQRPAGANDPLPTCGQDATSGGCIRLETLL
ncbi:type IV pilus assembly protein PilV [Modicisalibacter muralis]|uniref:Type IV pilus assembly protein PilV n=2 Tax=Modicisalibacter muralis TaxID=119000 RepID=A0A1G9QL15_9GAMM|nr:prepilin-type N-terminal cleavage/methylation domain-containing protein [Halomonas muralis]SDM11692.1 type IV pilus assembly protein PilV [Halomonas muralis]